MKDGGDKAELGGDLLKVDALAGGFVAHCVFLKDC